MTFTDCVEAAKSLGVPAALLVVLVWTLLRVGRYTTRKVIEPLTKAHLNLVNSMAQAIPQQVALLAQQGTTLSAIAATQERLSLLQGEANTELRSLRLLVENKK